MVNRVLWLPTGPRSKSSSRIQVYNIHDKLISLGYNSELVYEPQRTIWQLPLNKLYIRSLGLESTDLVIIQKFKTRSTLKYIQEIKKWGCKIGYIDCDEPISPSIAKAVDFVIVPSTFLKQRYEEYGVKCYCIQDCPEVFKSPEERQYKESEELRCVWFGNHSRSKWQEVTFFKRLLKERNITDWHFETISNTAKANYRWGKDSFSQLASYDLVVIPVPDMGLDYKGKSANRLLQSMALGLPILASPIPSYLEIAEQNDVKNLICETDEDWGEMLRHYTKHKNRVSSIKKNFEVAKTYALEVVINDWIEAFDLKKANINKTLDPKLLEKIKLKARFRSYEIKFA